MSKQMTLREELRTLFVGSGDATYLPSTLKVFREAVTRIITEHEEWLEELPHEPNEDADTFNRKEMTNEARRIRNKFRDEAFERLEKELAE